MLLDNSCYDHHHGDDTTTRAVGIYMRQLWQLEVLVKLACINNLSQIHYAKGGYECARQGVEQWLPCFLRDYNAASCLSLLEEPKVHELFLNVWLLKSNPFSAAPAAWTIWFPSSSLHHAAATNLDSVATPWLLAGWQRLRDLLTPGENSQFCFIIVLLCGWRYYCLIVKIYNLFFLLDKILKVPPPSTKVLLSICIMFIPPFLIPKRSCSFLFYTSYSFIYFTLNDCSSSTV